MKFVVPIIFNPAIDLSISQIFHFKQTYLGIVLLVLMILIFWIYVYHSRENCFRSNDYLKLRKTNFPLLYILLIVLEPFIQEIIHSIIGNIVSLIILVLIGLTYNKNQFFIQPLMNWMALIGLGLIFGLEFSFILINIHNELSPFLVSLIFIPLACKFSHLIYMSK